MKEQTNEKMTTRVMSEEALEIIERLCLFDDDFMSLVFERNVEATEYVINTILQRDDLKVLEVHGQREYKNPYIGGRIIKIDIYAKDANDKVYDIEVQCSDVGAIPRRARFHSAMVDVRMLNEKQKFRDLEDSYIIFITQNDVMKKGLPLYHIEREIRETGEDFNDGSHIIYVNGAYKNDEDPIGRLVHDFGCVRPSDMYSELLQKQVSYFKETEGGQNEMCDLVREAAEKVAKKMAVEMAESMAAEMAESMAAEMAEEIAEKKAIEIAESMANNTRIESVVSDVKMLIKNANMAVEVALDTLEIPEKDRDIIRDRLK